MFIAGIINHNRREHGRIRLEVKVSDMAKALLYRSSDSFYINGDDFSFVCTEDPMCSSNGVISEDSGSEDLILVYSGQIFNIDDLRCESSDSNEDSVPLTLKRAYKKWGYDFIKHVDGEFSITLYDKKEKKLIFARDRIGLKPFYYYLDEEIIGFASEIGALLKCAGKRDINYRVLHSSILYGSVFSREQILNNICELQPGYYMILDLDTGKPEIRKYWDISYRAAVYPESYYGSQFDDIFSDTVKNRIPRDALKVGVALSGGIDSSLIISKLKEIYNGQIETFTVGSESMPAADYTDAKHIAEYFNTKHHELLISADKAIEYLPEVIWHLCEYPMYPHAVSQSIMVYLIGKMAKENRCPVIFTGNGEELILSGNNQQRALYRHYSLSKRIPSAIRNVLTAFMPELLRRNLNLWTSGDIDKLEEKYIEYNSNWRKESFLKSCYTDVFNEKIGDYEAQSILSEHIRNSKTEDYFSKLLYLDMKTWNSRRNLILNERMLGASGIALQIPLLDSKLVEFCAGIPNKVKHNFSNNKIFIEKVYHEAIPGKIYKKGKYNSSPKLDFFSGRSFDVILHFSELLKKKEKYLEKNSWTSCYCVKIDRIVSTFCWRCPVSNYG